MQLMKFEDYYNDFGTDEENEERLNTNLEVNNIVI